MLPSPSRNEAFPSLRGRSRKPARPDICAISEEDKVEIRRNSVLTADNSSKKQQYGDTELPCRMVVATDSLKGFPPQFRFLQGLPCASLREGEDFLSPSFCKWVAYSLSVPHAGRARRQTLDWPAGDLSSPFHRVSHPSLSFSPIDLAHLVRLDVLKRRVQGRRRFGSDSSFSVSLLSTH